MADASSFIVNLAASVAEHLANGPMSRADLATETGASQVSVHRALTWLRDEGAPVSFDRSSNAWRMTGPWATPANVVEKPELIRAWSQIQQIRRLLEADETEVVADVEDLICNELTCSCRDVPDGGTPSDHWRSRTRARMGILDISIRKLAELTKIPRATIGNSLTGKHRVDYDVALTIDSELRRLASATEEPKPRTFFDISTGQVIE